MKHLLYNLVEAIRNGCLRIFPRVKNLLQPTNWTIATACLFLLSAACSTPRQVATQVVREVRTDTLYINNVQYDSIYIFQDKFIDRSRDTLLIKDKTVEYRYSLIRDTLYRTRIDTIPVVREVEVIREVRHIPWWSRLLSGVGAIALILLFILLFILLLRVFRGRYLSTEHTEEP